MYTYKRCRLALYKFLGEFNEKTTDKNIFTSNFLSSKNKYTNQCNEIIRGQRTVFILDLDDLLSISDSELKELVFLNTQRFLEILNSTLFKLFGEYTLNSKEDTIKFNLLNEFSNIKLSSQSNSNFYNLYNIQIFLIPPKSFPVENLDSLNASMIGKFILIEGICTAFTSKIIKLEFATYFCKICGIKISSKIKNSVFKPILFCFSKTCEKKYNRKLFLDICLSNFQTYQLLKISDQNEKNDHENSIEGVQIYLNTQLCEPITNGECFRYGGTLLPSSHDWLVSVNSCVDFFFQSMFIEKRNFDFYKKASFLIKQKYIFELFRSPNLYDRISNCLLPYFIGNSDLKKSITLSITSCNSYLKEKTLDIRQQIHILLIGDFEIGKSSLLKVLSTISPNSVYINSLNVPLKIKQNSEFDTENKFLITHKSKLKFPGNEIIFIDNAFFLKETELFLLDNVLENQIIITEKISQKTTIIASMTKFENFEIRKGQKKPNVYKTEFFQKFDLVFFQDSNSIDSYDEKISNYLLENFGKATFFNKRETFLDKDILRAFFKESEHIFPKFTNTSIEMVIYNYVLLKASDIEKFKKKLDIKILISIVRLSIALAKLNFKDLISTSDTKEAVRLLRSSFLSIANFKSSNDKICEISNENKIYNLIRKISLRLGKSILHLPYLGKLSSSMGFSRENFVKCLEMYENLNIWVISLKQMKLVFLV